MLLSSFDSKANRGNVTSILFNGANPLFYGTSFELLKVNYDEPRRLKPPELKPLNRSNHFDLDLFLLPELP